METPKEAIILALRSESLADVQVPGVVVELDPHEAEALGAFEETALTEKDAWESNQDLVRKSSDE